MDRRIKIEKFTTAQDGVGEPVKSWVELDTVWASVSAAGRTGAASGSGRSAAGTEGFAADQHLAKRRSTFRIRYRSDVDETMRIAYPTSAGDNYDIVSISELGRQEGLEITAEATVP